MTSDEVLGVQGAGPAGAELAVRARDEGWLGRIVLVSDESALPCHRPSLSKAYLAALAPPDTLALKAQATYKQAGVESMLGRRAISVDRIERRVTFEDGHTIAYLTLAFATVGRQRPLPVTASGSHAADNCRYLGDGILVDSCLRISDPSIAAAGDCTRFDSTCRGGGKADIEAFDLLDEKAVNAAVRRVVKRHGRLDNLLNYAGICLWGGSLDSTIDVWRRRLDTNLTAVYLLAVAWQVPPSRPAHSGRGVDLVGGVLYAPAIAAVLWSLSRMQAQGLGDAPTLALLLAGTSLLAFWARWEWLHHDPLVDVRRVGERQIGLAMVLMLLFGLGTAQRVLLMLAQQPLWTGVGLGLTATLAGAIKLPSNFMGLVGAPWSGRIAARDGARSAALWGSLIICAGWAGLTGWHGTPWLLVGGALVITLGGSMLFAAVPNLVVEVAPPERTSEITGLAQVVRTVGSAVGTQGASLLLAAWTVSDATHRPAAFPSAQAYMLTFAAITACAAAGVGAALALPLRSARMVVA